MSPYPTRRWRCAAVSLCTVLAACAGASRPLPGQDTTAVAPPPAPAPADTGELPPGYGTLRRDEIVIRFGTPQIELQVLPLDEEVIRLLAPDTYRSLAALVESQRAAVDSAARRAAVRDPTLMLVTVVGLVGQARFTPEDLTVTSRGRLFRPVGIVPLSPVWSTQQLDARDQTRAIYLFEDGILLRDPLTVTYAGIAIDSWARAVRTLERERARVRARAETPDQ